MRRNRRKLSPWQKIVRAAHFGTGLHLTADEASALADDPMIYQVAQDENEQQQDAGRPLPPWHP
jgi:hypothetical protein